jgi:hypothetical protein
MTIQYLITGWTQMGDQEHRLLKMNESFYTAMVNGDYQAMESLWANASDVSVIHPGWPALHGRVAVLDSWRRILSGVSTRGMYCSNARPYIKDQVAFVICKECFPEGELVATNIFVQEEGVWKLVHHQGGPLQSMDDDQAPELIH